MVANAALADELKQHNIKYWNDLLNYKFILEMADESLPIEKFVFCLRQDHIFLKEFCALLLIAKQKTNDQALMTWFGSLYRSTIDSEMHMQKELLSSLISDVDTSCATIARATLNYTSFLRQVSSGENIEVMVSSMAPCPWSYFEIAKLSKNSIKTDVYRKWMQFYKSNESQQQVSTLKNILGNLYDQADGNKKLLMKKHFGAACKHEYEFWEMAYNTSHTISSTGR